MPRSYVRNVRHPSKKAMQNQRRINEERSVNTHLSFEHAVISCAISNFYENRVDRFTLYITVSLLGDRNSGC